MSDAARITAGDADEPQEMRFPRADALSADPGFDVVPRLAAWLDASCAGAVSVAPGADPPMMTWWVRSDGATCGIGGGTALAAALLARDCGGGLDPGGASGPSVARALAALHLTLRTALVPGGEAWNAADAGSVPTLLRVTLPNFDDTIAVAATLPPPPAIAHARHAWRTTLTTSLARIPVPVQLVLHEARVPVRTIRALCIGDIVPIATARDVVLKVGRTAVARGRVTRSDLDQHVEFLEIGHIGGRT